MTIPAGLGVGTHLGRARGAWHRTLNHYQRRGTRPGSWRRDEVDSGLLTTGIGNPYPSGAESGFPAITEPLLDHDYFPMTTRSDEKQRIGYASRLAALPANPAAHEQAEDAIAQFCGPILEDMRRRRRLGRSGWVRSIHTPSRHFRDAFDP